MVLRRPGLVDYTESFELMKQFTEQRRQDCLDELWLLQHPAVFTQGRAGKAEHLLSVGDIPVVQADRGGQVTYHGPGQLVVYLMIDIKRLGIGVRDLVDKIEQSLVHTLAAFGIVSAPRPDAPGVYVGDKKIASLGLRIRQGRSFHGLALNIDNDLSPFNRINPCGYAGMAMTSVEQQLAGQDSKDLYRRVEQRLAADLVASFGYQQTQLLASLPSTNTLREDK
nr:lipoyl(octanoyl) transferase LipB [Sinobacterium norvegicum]